MEDSGYVKSRSKSIAALIRKLVALRQADTNWLSEWFPHYKSRIRQYETQNRQIKLDGFIDLMTALRCEVIVVPLGRSEDGWYRLNDFPDDEGMVLKMPKKIKKGAKHRRRE